MHKFNFETPNLLSPDYQFEVPEKALVPTLSIRCPHCSHIGAFRAITVLSWGKNVFFPEAQSTKSKTTLFGALRSCPNHDCQSLIFTVSYMDSSGKPVVSTWPQQLLDFNADGLNADLAKTLREAVMCHSVGAYRAAAMMVRRLLEEICDESGAEGYNLHERLASLRTKVILPEELFDAMLELKALGNDAAHITAKNYSSIGREEAEDSIELAKEILKARYQLKGLVERLRAKKNGHAAAKQ